MIEGQEDVTWPQWLALAQACEEHGVDGLFRSDHYRGGLRGTGGSLDAWATLAGLATPLPGAPPAGSMARSADPTRWAACSSGAACPPRRPMR